MPDEAQLLYLVERLRRDGYDCIRWFGMSKKQNGYAIARWNKGSVPGQDAPQQVFVAENTAENAWRSFLGWELNSV